MKKIALAAALIGSLLVSTVQANTVTIDHTWYGSLSGTIVFTGTPDSGGLINLADLTALSYSNNSSQSFNLSNVTSFGTFDVVSNVWSPNALDWDGNPDAFVCTNLFGPGSTWCFADVSFEQPLSYRVVSNVNDSTVPEPGSLALVGLALVGLAVRSKRRA